MNKLRAILVEDEPLGMDNLRIKLNKNCPEVEIVAECTAGAEAVTAILRHLPDVIFLDINLGDMTGFDVLSKIRHPSFEVIVTTSYEEYAIEAIKNNALDYLVKPIMVDELLEAVAKARMKLLSKSQQAGSSLESVTVNTSRKFGFPIATGIQFVELDHVVYVKAEENVAMVYLDDNKKIKLTKTLSWLEEELSDVDFCRVHHSYVINMNHMAEYIRNEGGYIVMSNKKAISISRRRKEAFLKKLEKFNK